MEVKRIAPSTTFRSPCFTCHLLVVAHFDGWLVYHQNYWVSRVFKVLPASTTDISFYRLTIKYKGLFTRPISERDFAVS